MKKYIKFAAFALIAALASCSSDDDVDYTDVGGNVVPATSITRLDDNYSIPLAIFTKAGVTATKIEIYKNTAKTVSDPIVLGAKVADATIADGKASFNSSTLGSFDVFPVTQPDGTVTLNGKTGTFPLALITTYSDGSTTKATYTLTVGKGITWQLPNADGELANSSTSGASVVRLNDPTPVKVNYKALNKATTTVTSVTAEYSKNGGDYTALPIELATTKQTIDIAAIPYSAYGGLVSGDVITFKLTVATATKTDAITTKITFLDQDFDALGGSGSIDNADATSQFSFLTSKNYDGAEDADSEIKFLEPFGIAQAANTTVKFVKPATALDYNTTNLEAGAAAFNAGTQVTSLTGLALNDVIIYQITRKVDFGTEGHPDIQDVTHYGLLKITDKVTGATSQKLSFDFKEGELILAD